MRSPKDKPFQAHTSSPIIALDSVSHSYPETDKVHPVLHNASLQIMPGEKLALLGRSGSGKTTLLNLIAGIDSPDSGKITVAGLQSEGLSDTERTLLRRHHIGFIYQFFNLVPSLSALENVALTLELNGVGSVEALEKSRALLQRLGISGKEHRLPSRLSGGEQQRVAIARALIHSPSIVLADEPTGNLDARTGEEVLGILHEVLSESHSCLLLVTHSLAVAKTVDRIMTMEDGIISEQPGEFAW